jgi:hypothetical protein
MKDLVVIAEKIAAILTARQQTIVVAESSTGGLVSAALLGYRARRPIFSAAVSSTRANHAACCSTFPTLRSTACGLDRTLCGSDGAYGAAAIFRKLGHGGNRRDWPNRQSLRRRGRA